MKFIKLKSVGFTCLKVTYTIKMPAVYTNIVVTVYTLFTILLTKAFYKYNEYTIDKLFKKNHY
uniref:Uncharacterized protein n=1 Tax=viral metagenome TaxID=1070528 RepID=A0A6C0BEY9_9ZZZZ